MQLEHSCKLTIYLTVSNKIVNLQLFTSITLRTYISALQGFEQ